jgi:uncharacterized protein
MIAMTTATFRFYAELNAFLPPVLRQRAFEASYARNASVKHAIESLGVPHTEVGLIIVNGEAAGFDRPLADGDRVAVYPAFSSLGPQAPRPPGGGGRPGSRGNGHGEDLRQPAHDGLLRGALPDELRFIADAHLGGLAHLLRMAGFDTLYDNQIADRDIEVIAAREQRIVLTRDRELLKRRSVEHGCYVRALAPREQLREIAARLALPSRARPFRLCLHCNAPLHRIAKEAVLDRIPPSVRERCERFATCDVCRRVYWEGSHWQRMTALMVDVMGPASDPTHSPATL